MPFPYKLYGGATRPDAISGLDPLFYDALQRMYQSAPPPVQSELGLTSAYRSRAVQQRLWEGSDKTGRTVARPGRSRHQFGTAADLYGFGLGKGPKVSPATRAWVHSNAAAHNMYFPMNYEPWHIQLAKGGGGMTKAVTPASPQQAMDQAPFRPMQQPQQQQQQQPLSQQFLAGLDFSPKTLFRNQLFQGMANPQEPFSRQTFMSDMMAGVSPLRRPIVQGLSRLFGLG